MIRKLYKNLGFLLTTAGNALFLLPLFRLFKKRYPCYAIPDADICIEGFPRSGNSFFVAVFQHWNPSVTIAHHSHLASNAKYYVKRGLPVVILIRDPAEAIASAIVWDGQDTRITPGVGLFSYLSFYRSLRKYRDKLLFLDFDEAVQDPNRCIERINQRFGAGFLTNPFDEEEKSRIQAALIRQDAIENRSYMNSTLPNERKNQLKGAISPEINSHFFFTRAQSVYEDYSRGDQINDADNEGKLC
jgi:hypothetical protein